MDVTDGRGADVVITAAASGVAQEQGLRMLAPRGRLSLFGGLPKDAPTITVDSNLVHYRELTIVGVNGSSPAHNVPPSNSSPPALCRSATSSPTVFPLTVFSTRSISWLAATPSK